MTPAQDALIRERYPSEGASESLMAALGEPAWRVRGRAQRLGVRLNAATVKAKRLIYNPSRKCQ